jgi:type I restriction enzyme S subunit
MGSAGQNGLHDTALAKGPGVVIGRSGASFGKVHFTPIDYWPHNTALYVTDFKGNDPRFAFYFLKALDFERYNSGSAQPSLNRNFIYPIPVRIPPLAEQKAIASVIGTLDDKIELNRRMNVTLESIARTLFQSWFIDFDPVRAKLDRLKPDGLDAETATLFPASFQDSPIGPVPKGWKVERFDAHITADRGLSYKGEGLRDDGTGIPMHNLNSVYEGGGYKHEGIKYYAGEYREKHLVEPGDMIVTNTEQGFDHLLIGHAAIVPKCYGPKGIYSHHIYRVRYKPFSPFSPHYLVELFNNRRWHYWISGYSNGTTINMLPMDALEMPMLVVPPIELVKKFTEIAEAAHLQVEDNKLQSRTLATIRDTLLPKLLTGELKARNGT